MCFLFCIAYFAKNPFSHAFDYETQVSQLMPSESHSKADDINVEVNCSKKQAHNIIKN